MDFAIIRYTWEHIRYIIIEHFKSLCRYMVWEHHKSLGISIGSSCGHKLDFITNFIT